MEGCRKSNNLVISYEYWIIRQKEKDVKSKDFKKEVKVEHFSNKFMKCLNMVFLFSKEVINKCH